MIFTRGLYPSAHVFDDIKTAEPWVIGKMCETVATLDAAHAVALRSAIDRYECGDGGFGVLIATWNSLCFAVTFDCYEIP